MKDHERLTGNVRRTGNATAAAGAYANTGLHLGDVYFVDTGAAQSAYREQVERIQPSKLPGRDVELNELARFSTAREGAGYAWWQAPAWAGKSALMSWFALHPPSNVRIVSFFITARYAANSDRNAFLDVVLEQLAEILERPLPQSISEATREALLLRLFKEAAHSCTSANQRLVLILDGLDEDRGVTAGPEAHSIAALLPSRLPTGMRVIVAGRPNPPIPADVPDDHPLLNSNVVRELVPSPDAQVIKAEALRELKQLLHGTATEQDLLGFIAAAGGGLSNKDLAELTNLSAMEIEDHLHTVCGRTFSIQATRWQPLTRPNVYLLAHEELQKLAVQYLGEHRLTAYRHRIHAWNDQYRDRGWPIETPEYLLRGYFQLLKDTDDIDRIVASAIDQKRLDRMLDISKGDAAAFTQLATAQNMILEQDIVDISAMLELCVARSRLDERNNRIPESIPATWATLGNVPRAKAIIRSISHPSVKARALVLLVQAIAASGDYRQAEEIVSTITDRTKQVEALALSLSATEADTDEVQITRLAEQATALVISMPDIDTEILLKLIGALAGSDRYEEAAELARSLNDVSVKAEMLAALAERAALDSTEQLATQIAIQAEALDDTHKTAGEISKARTSQVHTAILLARTFTLAGNETGAKGLIVNAEALASTIHSAHERAWAFISLIEQVAPVDGNSGLLQRLIDQTIATIDEMTDWFFHMQALAGLIEVMAAGGYDYLAEELRGGAPDEDAQAWATSSLALGVAERGDYHRAEALIATVTDQARKDEALTSLVILLARGGDFVEAERIAYDILGPRQRAEAMASLAQMLAGCDQDKAAKLAEDAETLSRSVTDPEAQISDLSDLAQALARIGYKDTAILILDKISSIVNSIADPDEAMFMVPLKVETLTAVGDYDEAERLVDTIDFPMGHGRACIALIREAASRGDFSRVEEILERISAYDAHIQEEFRKKAQGQALLANGLAKAGRLDEAEEVIRAITDDDAERSEALADLMEISAIEADHERISRLAGSIETIPIPEEPRLKARLYIALMKAAAVSGKSDRVSYFSRQAEAAAYAVAERRGGEMVLAKLVGAVVTAEGYARAVSVMETIKDPHARATAIVGLALSVNGDEQRRLAALALREGPWRISADLLAIIDGALLLRFAEQFVLPV